MNEVHQFYRISNITVYWHKCIFICIVCFSRCLLNNFLIWASLIVYISYALTQENHYFNVIRIREIQKHTKCATLFFHLNTKVSCTYVDFLILSFKTGYNYFSFEIIFSVLLECFSKLRNLKATRNLKYLLRIKDLRTIPFSIGS